MRPPLVPRLLLACLLLLPAACGLTEPASRATRAATPTPTADGRGDAPTPTPTATAPATPPPGTASGSPAPEASAPGATTPAPEPTCDDPLGCYGPPEHVGTFDVAAVPEASGLAASRVTDDVLYLLDDAPGTTGVHVVRTDGTALGFLEVAGMDTRDGESLAVGPCGPDRAEPWCLYVGDIGDNARAREHVVVHRVPEPDLAGGLPTGPVPADTARLRYPDGPHDAEALLVDDAGRVHLVTKARYDREARTTGETRLYRAEAFADGVMTDLGPLPVPAPRAPAQSLFVGEVVTGGDHHDGRVLLRTYDAVFEYAAPDGERDLAGLATWTVREVPAAFEPQSEALTFAADGCGFLTAGEAVGDLWLVPCLR